MSRCFNRHAFAYAFVFVNQSCVRLKFIVIAANKSMLFMIEKIMKLMPSWHNWHSASKHGFHS